MAEDSTIDWLRVMCDLKYRGYTMERIAQWTQIPVGTLKGYRQGAEPLHSRGQRILAMWAHVTGRQVVDAPKARKMYFRL